MSDTGASGEHNATGTGEARALQRSPQRTAPTFGGTRSARLPGREADPGRRPLSIGERAVRHLGDPGRRLPDRHAHLLRDGCRALPAFRHSNTLNVHLMARRGMRRRHISVVPLLITAALYVVYGTVLCGSPGGQTVGMMAVGVQAVREGSLGVLGYGRALGRALVEGVLRLIQLLFFVLGLIWLLDMLFPLWDGKRQTLHDKVAGFGGPPAGRGGIDC